MLNSLVRIAYCNCINFSPGPTTPHRTTLRPDRLLVLVYLFFSLAKQNRNQYILCTQQRTFLPLIGGYYRSKRKHNYYRCQQHASMPHVALYFTYYTTKVCPNKHENDNTHKKNELFCRYLPHLVLWPDCRSYPPPLKLQGPQNPC